MAKLYVTEFGGVGGSQSPAQAPSEWKANNNIATLSGSNQQTSAFGDNTRLIAVSSDGIFSAVVGDNPVATTNDMRVPADTIVFFTVKPGQKLAAVSNT